MKTTTIIKTAFILLITAMASLNTASAATVRSEVPASEMNEAMLIRLIAPVAPSVVTFEDAEAELTVMPLPAGLAPGIPAEADFSDAAGFSNELSRLAPVTPLEADFEVTE